MSSVPSSYHLLSNTVDATPEPVKSIFNGHMIPVAVDVDAIEPVTPLATVDVPGFNQRAPSVVILTAVITVPLNVN